MQCYFKEFTYKNLPLLWHVDTKNNSAVATQLYDPQSNTVSRIQSIDQELAKYSDVSIEQDSVVIKDFEGFKNKKQWKPIPYQYYTRQISSDKNLQSQLTRFKLQSSSIEELPTFTNNPSDEDGLSGATPTTPRRTSRSLTATYLEYNGNPTSSNESPRNTQYLSETFVQELEALKPNKEKLELKKIILPIQGDSLCYSDMAESNSKRLTKYKSKTFLSSLELGFAKGIEVNNKAVQLRAKQNVIYSEIVDNIFNNILSEVPTNISTFKSLQTHILQSVTIACSNSPMKERLLTGNFLHDEFASASITSEELVCYKLSESLEDGLVTALTRGFILSNLPLYLRDNLKSLRKEGEYSLAYQNLFDTMKEFGKQSRLNHKYKQNHDKEITRDVVEFGDDKYKSIDLIIDRIEFEFVPKFAVKKTTHDPKNPPSPTSSPSDLDSQKHSRFSFMGRRLSGNNLKNDQDPICAYKRAVAVKVKEAIGIVINSPTDNSNNNNSDDRVFIKQEFEEKFIQLLKEKFSFNTLVTSKDLETIKKYTAKNLVTELESWLIKLNHNSSPILEK
ncbi:MAG: hypothetical protein H0U71_00090 [Gammaproteobacteria bacterium]|nr:hypothetical protein [Gammaproteobacteria bacterium]